MVPKRLTKWQNIIDANIDEIKSDFIFISKKAVIDFVLGESLDNSCDSSGIGDGNDANTSRERREIKDIGKHHAHM